MEVVVAPPGTDSTLTWTQLMACGVVASVLALTALGCCILCQWGLARCSTNKGRVKAPAQEIKPSWKQCQAQDQGTQTIPWEPLSKERSPVNSEHQTDRCMTPLKRSDVSLRAMVARASPVLRDVDKWQLQAQEWNSKERKQ